MNLFIISSISETSYKINWFLKKYSDLLSSTFILVNDIFYLLGESIKRFPKTLSNVSFTILNVSGLFFTSFEIDLLGKTLKDLLFAKKMNNNRIFIIAAVKCFYVASGVLLLGLSSIASLLRLMNQNMYVSKIFQITRPYSIICISMSLVLDIFHYYTNKQAAKVSDSGFSDKQIAYLSDLFSNGNKLDSEADLNYKAAEIRERMDKDTWKSFQKNLSKTTDCIQKRKLFSEVVSKNIRTQSTIASSSLVFKGLGYIIMPICAMYPATAIQAACWTFMSLLYLSQIIYQKFVQKKQQNEANRIILENRSPQRCAS